MFRSLFVTVLVLLLSQVNCNGGESTTDSGTQVGPLPELFGEPMPVGEAETQASAEPELEASAEPETSVEPEAEQEGTSGPEPESEASVESNAEPEGTPEPETEPEGTSEPRSEPEASAEPEVEPEASPEPEASSVPAVEPENTSEPEAEPEGTPEPEGEPEGASEQEAEHEGTSEPETEPEGTSEPAAEPGDSPEPESSADPEVEPEASAEPEVEPEASSEHEGEPEASAEPEAEPEASPEPEASAEPEVEPEGTSEPEGEPGTSVEPEVEPEGTSGPKVEPEVSAEPETEPEGTSEAEPVGESEPESEPEAEPEGESEPETEPRPEGESETEAEPEGESEAEVEPEETVESGANPEDQNLDKGPSKTPGLDQQKVKENTKPESLTPDGPQKLLGFQLSLNKTFNANLRDPEATEYRDLEKQFISTFTSIYEGLAGFKEIKIIGFSSGSVIVDYVVIFAADEAPSDDVIASTVQETMSSLLSNGTGGNDVSSLGITMETVGTLRRMQLSQEALQGLSSSALCTLSCGTAASCTLRDVYGTLVAECRCDDGYCLNSGTCEFLQGTGPVCRCGADPSGFYSGARCELYAPRALVILFAAGVGGLLVLLSSVLSVCLCVKNRLNQLDSYLDIVEK
ncbi:uncharacterized protein LOC144927295 [Branchiostoma floridae x Branchiostoma belcheri]